MLRSCGNQAKLVATSLLTMGVKPVVKSIKLTDERNFVDLGGNRTLG